MSGMRDAGYGIRNDASDFDLPIPHSTSRIPSLVVFAKTPEAGRVKTRLTPPLAPAVAADLYAAFLGDALDGFIGLGVDVRLYLPESDAAMPDGLVPAGVTLCVQQGDGLGARMDAALTETLASGAGRAVVIGTDHPTLPLAHVTAAFEALTEPGTVVIGPTEDGGFYLIGVDRPRPALFDGMAYSHAGVFAETCARAEVDGARLHLLPTWFDVDDGPSLARLVAEWRGGADVGARTSGMLTRLGRRAQEEAQRKPAAPR